MRVLALVGAVALAAVLVTPVVAAPKSALSSEFFLPSGWPSGSPPQSPVEQQSDNPWLPGPTDCSANTHCVVNPTLCAWDVDDWWQVVEVDRTLAAATTTTGTVCGIFDANPQYVTNDGVTGWWNSPRPWFGMRLLAPSSSLGLTVTFLPQGRTFTPSPRWNGSVYEYDFCGVAIYAPGDPALVSIVGSGGSGVRTDVTVSVANLGRQAVRKITADVEWLGVGRSLPSCTSVTPRQTDYPFTWAQS
jgi:hypothetical protein